MTTIPAQNFSSLLLGEYLRIRRGVILNGAVFYVKASGDDKNFQTGQSRVWTGEDGHEYAEKAIKFGTAFSTTPTVLARITG